MFNDLASLKTDPALLASLDRAKHQKMTAGDLLEQRVSFVYSAMKKEGVTREHVRSVMLEHDGGASKGGV